MEKDIEFIREKMEDMHKDFKEFVECADKKYANKIVERIVYGLVGTTVVATISAIVTKIIGLW